MSTDKNDIKDTLGEMGDALKKDAHQTKEDMKKMMPKGKHSKDSKSE